MLQINNITYFVSNRTLFSKINFLVQKGDRIGLVGPNGVGKTTLLRLMTGRLTPDEGEVQLSKGMHLGYLEQEVHEKSGTRSIREVALEAFRDITGMERRMDEIASDLEQMKDYNSVRYHDLLNEMHHLQDRYTILEGDKMVARTEAVLEGLGFRTDQLDNSLNELSGGWRMRVSLAKILLSKPDVLLLDEPTNHLDIDSIEWLEQYLKDFPGAVMLVSHDQHFLNRLVESVFEIRNKKIYEYKGNYDDYLVQREEQIEQHRKAYEAQQKEIAQTQQFIDRFRAKATKAKQVQSRIRQIEKLDEIEPPEPEQASLNFRFPDPPRSGKVVMGIHNLIKSYADKDHNEIKVFTEGQDLQIERGDKVAVIGVNGAGKSTLARIINGNEAFDGERTVGHNVTMTFFEQHLADVFDSDRTVLDEMESTATATETRTNVRTILGCFLFSGDDVLKPVKVLSGGEKSRVALAKTLIQPSNLIILDEPTNHLDIQSKNILLDAIKAYDGTVVAISHDRHFLAGFADKIWRVENGKVTVYQGGYDYYVWKRQQTSYKEGSGQTVPVNTVNNKMNGNTGPKSKERKRMEAELRNRLHRETKEARKKIKALEKEIELLETRKTELEENLADPGFYQTPDAGKLMSEFNRLEHTLDRTMEQWTIENEKLETMENKIRTEQADI